MGFSVVLVLLCFPLSCVVCHSSDDKPDLGFTQLIDHELAMEERHVDHDQILSTYNEWIEKDAPTIRPILPLYGYAISIEHAGSVNTGYQSSTDGAARDVRRSRALSGLFAFQPYNRVSNERTDFLPAVQHVQNSVDR